MRAVKNNLPTPSGEVGELEGLDRAKARLGALRVGGWNSARNWDHATHPFKVTARCGLPAERRVLARRGWAGEMSGHFEHPARGVLLS